MTKKKNRCTFLANMPPIFSIIKKLWRKTIVKVPVVTHGEMLVITGEAGAGKDTFADHIQKMYSAPNTVIHRVTFATKLKEEAKSLGWNGKKDEKGRELLQDLGKVMKNYYGQDYYAKQAFIGKKPVPGVRNIWVVTDARFLAEINYCKEIAEKYNADIKIIRIDRSEDPNFHSSLTETQKNDVSEQEWRQVQPDIVVKNDGKDPDFGGFLPF